MNGKISAPLIVLFVILFSNSVRIGDAVVNNLPSADGKPLRFALRSRQGEA